MPLNLSRGRILGLISFLLLAAFFLAGQTWYLVSMSPNDEAITLRSFDGYSSYPWISPLLLVCLAALATSAISSGGTRLTSLSVGIGSSFLLAVLSTISISTQDLSGVAKALETATGIAATHGVEGLAISTQPMALACAGLFVGLGLLFAVAIWTSRSWKANRVEPSRRAIKPVKDSISLWDEQR